MSLNILTQSGFTINEILFLWILSLGFQQWKQGGSSVKDDEVKEIKLN